MLMEKRQNGNAVTLKITGMIDTVTSSELNEELGGLDYTNLDLTLDFSDTDYITSAGLRVLLVAKKNLGNRPLKIIGVNAEIEEVFKATGFSEIVDYKVKNAPKAPEAYESFKALLLKAVKNAPDKTVFVYKQRKYTFSDIDKASQIIANDLSRAGVKKGSHVGICSANSINWIFTFYAVQKLGAIAVLVNFNLKPAEIIALAEIGDITHLCYGTEETCVFEEYKKSIEAANCSVKYMYDISPYVDFTERFGEYGEIKDKFSENFHADDAGVIIYTSGSTGKPKAVLLSSYNLISSVLPLVGEFKMGNGDRNCAFLPFFHVFGFSTCITLGVLKGIVSYIPEKASPAVLLDIISKNRCTMFHSVPTMMLAMVSLPDFSPELVSSVRISALGGAAIPTPQMEMLMRLFPNDRFSNVYGMSENAAISITPFGDTPEHITETVGIPLPHIELQIRDTATGEVLTKGQAGEIFIRASTMIICYYKMSIENQPLDTEGWLATGDLGMITENGYLKLVGRVKDLIIRGGENISPREVADSISLCDAVEDVKVVGVPDTLYGEEVAAAIVLKKGKTFDGEEMKRFLSDKLAKYKIPSHFVLFDAFPLLGSGKTDDKAIKKAVIDAVKGK